MHIAYINGAYQPIRLSSLSVQDRATQFADAAYEVLALLKGQLQDVDEHLNRLDYSLKELSITPPFASRKAFLLVLNELIRRNHLSNAICYIQVSRGEQWPRKHDYPSDLKPSCSILLYPLTLSDAREGLVVITQKDLRWQRCDIKSVSLLPNIMSKQQAKNQGADEAILINEHQLVTEASTSNVFIIHRNGTLMTHPKNHRILGGITRQLVIKAAKENGIDFLEEAFSLEDLMQARAVFLTSTTKLIAPVAKVNQKKVGSPEGENMVRHLIDNLSQNSVAQK